MTLFFHSAARFQKNDLLELDIRDVETLEQFPPGGIKLTVGRACEARMTEQPFELDELDKLANEAFPGMVVRKDLLRRMRTAFGVPAFVIEFLLGKYCASTDDDAIREGLEFVRETLAQKYVKPDEARGREVCHQAAHDLRDHRQNLGPARRNARQVLGAPLNLDLDHQYLTSPRSGTTTAS